MIMKRSSWLRENWWVVVAVGIAVVLLIASPWILAK